MATGSSQIAVAQLALQGGALFGNRKKRILANGAQAPAVVTAVDQQKILGVPVGQRESYKFDLTLMVRPQNEPPFEARVSRYYYKDAQPGTGMSFIVRYDPNDRTHVEIDDSLSLAAGSTVQDRRRDRDELVAKILHGEPNPSGKPYVTAAVAEEVRRVAALREHGDLTEDEFQAQIAELFASS